MKINDRENLDKTYRHLKSGKSYKVVASFEDYDGCLHDVGEHWIFIGSNFVPYEDGLSLFAVINGVDSQVRLQHRLEEQSKTIENIEQYLLLCE